MDYFESSRSINILEYVGVIMNVWFMHFLLRGTPLELPCCHFWTDNEAARAWTALAHLPSLGAAALSRLLDVVMTHTNMHTRSGHTPGVVNEVADGMSRRPTAWSAADTELTNALASRPPFALPTQIDRILHPPEQLVSVVLQALLFSRSPSVPQLIDLTRNISFNISASG